ncbi:TRAP transporter small permease [Rhizobium halophytocola]|uniref:TRAP transporter small permease protein n=1 Tax=Rhizobium halophytocola TaxID=735519 RepID=A0ABS4DT81_9HYPH|nr:TRAP transporter small permease [Rhizobium halophytocola]MBP1848824.1 TRAP-type C4-dicarboxylate transport system permease small subunit [Rhizobium halophytocola]
MTLPPSPIQSSPLTPLYRLAEVLAGLSLILIFVLVGGGVLLRMLGMQLAGSDDFAAYGLVAVFFLALGPTYRRNEHIRVGLIIERLAPRAKAPLEIVLTVLATIATAWATWWLGRMVYDSHRFHDVAQGLIAIPLWLPQLTMVIGTAVLLVALVEDLVRFARRQPASYIAAADAGGEDIHFER